MRKNITKLMTAVLVALLALATFQGIVYAEDDPPVEDPTVRNYEKKVSSTKQFYEFQLDRDTYDEDLSNIPSDFTLGNDGDTYVAYYPDALTYYGETKSVKVEVVYRGFNRYQVPGDQWMIEHPDRSRGIKLESDHDIQLYAVGISYDITYTFYDDPEFTDEAEIYGAVAFDDPDFGNYLYSANTRKLYYYDVAEVDDPNSGRRLIDNYIVSSNGIMNLKADGTDYLWIDFDSGTFAAPLVNESSFTYRAEGLHDYLFLMTRIIQTHAPYTVEYYYETAGGYPQVADDSKEYFADLYENKSTVNVSADDKKPNQEIGKGYVLNEEKDEEWEAELLPNGKTVLKVYFKHPYTIKYHPNATDVTNPEAMEDDNYTKSDPRMDSKDEWVYNRPTGYDFVGYKIENEGKTYTDPQDFKDMLIEDGEKDDGIITLYAQWKPWNYYIHYDPNGGEGKIDTQTFDYEDEVMNSETNDGRFKRSGYKFAGFDYYDADDVNHENPHFIPIEQVNDFNDFLKDLGKNAEVILYARWTKISPSYALPVTGVE